MTRDPIDFSRNVAVYDQRHGAFLASEAAAQLAQLAGLTTGARVIDVAAGRGRVAVPLATWGCRVLTIDVSHAMLASISAKASTVPFDSVVGDATHLPLRSESCDAVVIARLLYLVPEWTAVLDEAFRVLRPGGHLLYEWGNGTGGEDWVQIREHARHLFEEAGVSEPFHPGVRSDAHVTAHVLARGFALRAAVEFAAQPTPSLRTFVDQIVAGETSYTWNVPLAVQQRCLPALAEWSQARFDLNTLIDHPMQWKIYVKP